MAFGNEEANEESEGEGFAWGSQSSDDGEEEGKGKAALPAPVGIPSGEGSISKAMEKVTPQPTSVATAVTLPAPTGKDKALSLKNTPRPLTVSSGNRGVPPVQPSRSRGEPPTKSTVSVPLTLLSAALRGAEEEPGRTPPEETSSPPASPLEGKSKPKLQSLPSSQRWGHGHRGDEGGLEERQQRRRGHCDKSSPKSDEVGKPVPQHMLSITTTKLMEGQQFLLSLVEKLATGVPLVKPAGKRVKGYK